MKLWRAWFSGLLITTAAYVHASGLLLGDSGWLFAGFAAFFIISAALIFIIRGNRKLKALVIAGQRVALMQQNRGRVLSMIVEQAPLQKVLDALVEGAEQMDPSARCTVLLLDEQGILHVASAPHLPDEYNAAIDGIAAGYGVGSCGTAAYLGQRVIVEDVRVHPYWQPYQALVDIAGIRSCWSEPIKNRQGKVLDILNQNFPLCSFVTSPCYRMSSAANCYYSINIENISILVVN